MSVKILDCTLRDGGYYNAWDFDFELVDDYLLSMARAGVDYVELGLRQFKQAKYLGASGYTTYDYLAGLSLPSGPVYGVMVDAKTILGSEYDQRESIDRLFKSRSAEKIGLVRVAAHFHEVLECRPMLSALKAKGYVVGLNLMQASLRTFDELSGVAKAISGWESVDVLYFADSLGSMQSDDVTRVYEAFRQSWSGDIGFHAHNNSGNAVANVKHAIDCGCLWVDATVCGMGRGAGNAELEYLLHQPELQRNRGASEDLSSLVVNYFEPLKQHFRWGLSLPYYRAASLGIHPTYVQELLSDTNLDRRQVPKLVEDIGSLPQPHVFSRSTLNNVISKTNKQGAVLGTAAPPIFLGKEVVLVAQTDLAVKHKRAIADYVRATGAILIAINLPLPELDLAYDFVGISHNRKFRDEESRYVDSTYKFVAPQALFGDSRVNIVHNYGLQIREGCFACCGSYVTIPTALTVAYVIGFCIDAKAQKISLVGFGGYSSDNPRQKEMQELIALLQASKKNIKSLTPTTYSIAEESIYCV